MLLKINVLKNFAIFTGKHLCSSLFLIKLTLLKETPKQVFFSECCEIFLFQQTPLVVAFAVLKNFAKIPGNHNCIESIDQLQALANIFTKKELCCNCFLVNSAKDFFMFYPSEYKGAFVSKFNVVFLEKCVQNTFCKTFTLSLTDKLCLIFLLKFAECCLIAVFSECKCIFF